ncbi:uncharacterized protein BDR25DRAFT_345503 [Lindgomyces ingoldianus]|uniref:Uncharacterized protein n=1 Tax=Lindgomyces ingoldianus TaxID=673940 RepID=A0ACB6QK20_9PLEO|nr:uncharacterized protein BDR25DRAFT_345503 [Lindgomyces ingoldianus]KAF2466662.1 hypothetical protein BDR25DRAFT_345503 [Lindgomyces ingoldianus]
MDLRWTSKSVVLIALISLVGAHCATAPLALSIENVTLSDGVAKNRGIHVDLGGQPEGFRISFAINNTRVRNAQDCQVLGNATLRSKCLGSSGGVYDVQLHTFNTSGSFNVSHIDTPPKNAVILQGADEAVMGNITIPRFPFEVWHDPDSLNKSGIAFGPDSSVLAKLVDYGFAPSKFFGLFFGSRSQNQPQDGQVIVGGYNVARIRGPFTNFSMTPLGLDTPCPLQVQIKDVVLNNSQGSYSLMPDIRSTVAACIDPLQNQFTFTQAMYALWKNYTRHNDSADYTDQTYPPESEAPVLIDNLTVTLSNGYTVVVPKYELLSLERGANDVGEYAIVSQKVMAAVGKGPTDFGRDIPILGGTFLSQNYLFVDYESRTFGLAPANVDRVNIMKGDIRTVCKELLVEAPQSHRNVGVIVGPAIGGVAATLLILTGIWCWRRRRPAREGTESGAAEDDDPWKLKSLYY